MKSSSILLSATTAIAVTYLSNDGGLVAAAFAPPHTASLSSSRQRQSRSSSTSSSSPLNSAIISAILLPNNKSLLPNPYESLPWNIEREEKRKARRLSIANAALFRELGLPEDATYEDVASRTEHLIELSRLAVDTGSATKNEGIKRRIQIEIARDKIYQIRLNERISGVRSEQDDAARVSKLEESGIEGLAAMTSDSVDDIIKPKQKLRIPIISGLSEYINSCIVPPDSQLRRRQLLIWGCSTLVCLLNPPLTEGFGKMNWLPAGGMMGYRGMPGIVGGEGGGYNPYRGNRNKKHQVQAMGIAIFGWVLAKMVAESVVSRVPAMAVSRSAEWFRFAIVQTTLGVLVSYIQTYKEGESDMKELMI